MSPLWEGGPCSRQAVSCVDGEASWAGEGGGGAASCTGEGGWVVSCRKEVSCDGRCLARCRGSAPCEAAIGSGEVSCKGDGGEA
jgi:hypothetical protein